MKQAQGRRLGRALLALTAAALTTLAAQAEVGQIKVAKGQVSVDRKGQALPGQVGMLLEPADVLKTGADGSVGVTMRDNSLLSAGPNSILALERFEFDATTSQGRFDAKLQRGTLAVVSGRIAKQSPQAMTVRTPSAVLGVRGTEFVVAVDE
ncbi:MAG: FecR domain-containing protein [Pseudomonadota bacterium]